jgi:hypothetical protein
MAHYEADGARTVDLLVMWRGSPGWFSRPGGDQSSASGGGGSGGVEHHRFSFGGLSFAVDLDFGAATAAIAGHTISLRDTNVVLLDRVDGGGRPELAAARLIDARVAEGGDPVTVLVKRNQELYDYLQCDRTLPDTGRPDAAAVQAMLAVVCGQMRPQ